MNHHLLGVAERKGNPRGMHLVQHDVQKNGHEESNPTGSKYGPEIEWSSILSLPESTVTIHQSHNSDTNKTFYKYKLVMEIKGYKPNVDKEHQNHVGSLLDQCGQVQVFLLLSFLIFNFQMPEAESTN